MKNILQRAKEKIPSYGVYITMSDPTVLELAVKAGFDFARIDCEHTLVDPRSVVEMFRVARLLDFPLQIRVTALDTLPSYLVMEPSAIVLPDMESQAQAQAFVDAVKFAPLGKRGMYSFTRAIRFGGIGKAEYLATANEKIHTLVQIESKEGLAHIDEILSTPGIDMVTPGKADLSQALGVSGQSNHPSVLEAVDLVVATAHRYGKVPVLLVDDQKQVNIWKEKGVYCFYSRV